MDRLTTVHGRDNVGGMNGTRVVIVAVACCLLSVRASAEPRCGSERRLVKLGGDETASLVSGPVRPATVDYLSSLPRPSHLPKNRRAPDTAEIARWRVTATVRLVRLESDGDYHVVIADDAGRTMIVESPSEKCAGYSLWREDLLRARRLVGDLRVGMRVAVTGVGFFDHSHRQTGVAPNAIELHPVLDVETLP